MRKFIQAANWKMNKTPDETKEFIKSFLPLIAEMPDDREAVIIPAFVSLHTVEYALRDSAPSMGAQNLYFEESGAYTGEISGPMLKSSGCEYVVIGHSERRQSFGDTNQSCNKKIRAAYKFGLTPIYCIGESLEQRNDGVTLKFVESQIIEGLKDVSVSDAARIVLAYEPIWAIGTGVTATTEQAQEVHAHIRKILSEIYDADTANAIRIQYGGSVKPGNVDDLMRMPDIDGALVGGASLDPESFARIVMFE